MSPRSVGAYEPIYNSPRFVSAQLLRSSAPAPWAVLHIFAFLPILLTTGWLTRAWLNRIGRRHNKAVQKRLFERLLATAGGGGGGAEPPRLGGEAQLGQWQHAMMENGLELFHGAAAQVHAGWMVALCLLMCVFMRSVMFVAVVLPLLDCATRMRRYRRTVRRYAMLESETRLRLLHVLGNQLRGRVVIQSFDAVQRLRASVYRTVEENSAAELVMRAAIAYNQHAFVFWQGE